MGTKDVLLKLLENNRDEFISGKVISAYCGVSGTAVWKAVNSLRKDGYLIDAVTNRGYKLRTDNDVLNTSEIEDLLFTEGSSCYIGDTDIRIEIFDTVSSTNTICREHASQGEPEGYIAIAGNQTKGRGRWGREFFSPAGSGLYMSMLMRPEEINGKDALHLTTMAAVAVAQAIEAVSDKKAKIKWVNDIFIDDRKVCGILTEGSFNLENNNLECAVVGIGINVFDPFTGFPKNIAATAGAVFGPYDTKCTRGRLAAEVISRFMKFYRQFCDASGSPDTPGVLEYIDDYRRRCFVIGKEIDVMQPGRKPRRATALGLDHECKLYVRYEDGENAILDSGEISIRTV